MVTSSKDFNVLRELGKKVAEIAALPVQQEKIRLWKALNSLKPVRPMIMIDQIPWHEMELDGELTLECEDEFLKTIEWRLRTELYKWKYLRTDMVVEPYIDIPKAIVNSGFGIKIQESTAVKDPKNDIVGHSFFDQLASEEDLEKIKQPEISLDEECTKYREEVAHEIFDNILEVRMTGFNPGFAPWDQIVQWHGVENSLFDLADRPEFIHELMRRVTNAYLGMLDQLEEKQLLTASQATVHCSGAYTDELPLTNTNQPAVRAKDIWTHGMAQIFATVSPAMVEEFEIEYAVEWYKRFGLVYYGCCEPLHNKIHIIKKIPGLRKISISPWANFNVAAEEIKSNYVISSKPSPALLADDLWDKDMVKKTLQNMINVSRNNGCPLEFILKDISTLKYKPERLMEWSEIAMDIVTA